MLYDLILLKRIYYFTKPIFQIMSVAQKRSVYEINPFLSHLLSNSYQNQFLGNCFHFLWVRLISSWKSQTFLQTLTSWPIRETILVTHKSYEEREEEEAEEDDIFSSDSTRKWDITTSLCIKGTNSLRSRTRRSVFVSIYVGEDQLSRRYLLLIKHLCKNQRK